MDNTKVKRDNQRHLYALYDNDDMPIFVGDAHETAQYLGIKVSSLHSRIAHNRHRRKGTSKKKMYLYDVGRLNEK